MKASAYMYCIVLSQFWTTVQLMLTISICNAKRAKYINIYCIIILQTYICFTFSNIIIFLVCISGTTICFPICSCPSYSAKQRLKMIILCHYIIYIPVKNFGIIPVMVPPLSITLSARLPIKPNLLPP